MIRLNDVAVEQAMSLLVEGAKTDRGPKQMYKASILGELPAYAMWTRDSQRYKLSKLGE